MDYLEPSSHRFESAISYAEPVARQLFPASMLYGVLAVFSHESLRAIFEQGLLEHLASLTLPVALAAALVFSGLALLLSGFDGRPLRYARKAVSYWAKFTIGLSGAVLGVAAGIAIPFAYLNGLFASLALVFAATLAGASFMWLAHTVCVTAHSEWPQTPMRKNLKLPFAISLVSVGLMLFTQAVLDQWVGANAF